MKSKNIVAGGLAIFMIVIVTSLFNVARAQTDTSKVVRPDTVIQQQSTEEAKKEKKRKDEFIVYIGANFNQLMVSSSEYESNTKVGFHLGGAYKRGKFFYWQVGARFNYAQYQLSPIDHPEDSTDVIGISSIDIPVTGGINFLAFVNRLVALRLFVSAVPSFALGVGENDLGFSKDHINTFVFYGQAGLGINVAFFLLEAGYNYGFQDLLKNDIKSKPGQVFINLGFRF